MFRESNRQNSPPSVTMFVEFQTQDSSPSVRRAMLKFDV